MQEISVNKKRIENLAHEVIVLSRNTLMVNLRFLDLALSQFQYISTGRVSIATDGYHLFYNPIHILSVYKKRKEASVRDYLHIVLHCVFRHMYFGPGLDRTVWDLACDIAVESVINELGLKSATDGKEDREENVIQALKSRLGSLTAEKIYRFYIDEKIPSYTLEDVFGLFEADSHDLWYAEAEEIEELIAEAEGNASGGKESIGGRKLKKLLADQNGIWKAVSERMGIDLESFSKQMGTHAGGLVQNLAEVNRERYDYSAFLKKFAVLGEAMKINDDEFDYIYYTYGLKNYGNMPLIEPLEYKEVKAVREFVIAIDTSGSVAGEAVQSFVQKTYNILKSTESFFRKINLHIIQCDADIQEHIKITSQEEFDGYLKHMTIKGLGGTDFRPVFKKVDELVEMHEFTNLKGMIYLTDGFGTFPQKPPKYQTAFVFVGDECDIPPLPSWAIKLVLRKEDL